MTTTKPTRMWHADGEGKCHAGCEAYVEEKDDVAHGSIHECMVLHVLPWMAFKAHPNRVGFPCPFAVLADVLALHERQPDPKPDEDRRCGTCAAVDCLPILSRKPWPDDGPPWPNCRLWRKR